MDYRPPLLTSLKIQKRLVIAALGLGILLSLLIARFYILQIVQNDKWQKIALRQHFFTVSEPGQRGLIWSYPLIKGHQSKPRPWVLNVQYFHLHADPKNLPEIHHKAIADQIAAVLSLEGKDKESLVHQLARKSRSRRLANWLSREKHDQIAEWWESYARREHLPRNALFFLSDYKRTYPFGELLGPLLHTIRSEGNGNAVPTGGIELACDLFLKGHKGEKRLKRSARQSFEMGEVLQQPKAGSDVYLTIDPYLQTIVEEELRRGVHQWQSKGAWAVLMQPYSGEVIAIGQYPSFDPSRAEEYFNNPDNSDAIRLKAVSDAYEPGSVVKALTITAALQGNAVLQKRGEAPLFDPEIAMDVSRGHFPGRATPLRDGQPHHFLNLDMAIQKSSNIYPARLLERIINRLGREWHLAFLRQVFGLGEKCGIEITGESGGKLPAWKSKGNLSTHAEWSASTPSALAIGYNLQVTALQLARAYSVLANGGYLVRPTLIKKIIDPQGAVLVDKERERRQQPFPCVLDPAIARRTVKALKYVTKAGGLARRADLYGYSEAGKSGTCKKLVGQNYEDRYRASFVGFTPTSTPAFVLAITLDEPLYQFLPGIGKTHNGGICAASLFHVIGQRVLDYLQIASDDPYGYAPGDPRANSDKADWCQETKTLQKIYETWNKKGSSAP